VRTTRNSHLSAEIAIPEPSKLRSKGETYNNTIPVRQPTSSSESELRLASFKRLEARSEAAIKV